MKSFLSLVIQCQHLTQLDPNLFIQYTDPDRKVNSTVNFQCKQGYHLDDETAVRQCEWNGNWTGKINLFMTFSSLILIYILSFLL